MKKIKLHISLLDWVFIIGLIVGALVLFFYFKRETTYITVTLKVTDKDVLYARSLPSNEFATSFAVGDEEVDDFGRSIAKITKVESYPIDLSSQVVYVTMRLKAIYNPRNKSYSYGGKKVIFGESIDFFSSKVKFSGMVVDFPNFLDGREVQEKDMIVKAQLRREYAQFSDTHGVPDYIANAVKTSDEIKDSNGTIRAKVLDVLIVPAERTVITQDGQAKKTTDPVLKDVFYTLSLHVRTINGTNYSFNYSPVVIDQYIPLNFKNITIWPAITEI